MPDIRTELHATDPPGSLRVLLVEDSPDDAELIRLQLAERPGFVSEVVHEERIAAALDRLDAERFDVVLLDLSLPDASGLETLSALVEAGVPDRCPIVIISGSDDERLAISALQCGAQDYVVKSDLATRFLTRTLRGAIERHRMGRELQNARERAQRLATHCSLTGLPNRYLLQDRFSWALAAAARDGTRLAVLFVDLDRFKVLNDTLGHPTADEVLRTIAQRLVGSVRSSDTAARVGGDEFVILLRGIQRPEDAAGVARDVLHKLAEPLVIEGRELVVGASVGIAVYPEDGRDSEALLRRADAAMYRVKAAGGGDFRFSSGELDRASYTRLLRQVELQRAVTRGEFLLHYQPKVCGESGVILGCEALIRWMHPDHGLIAPGEFIPLAEESSLIGTIGAFALREACSQHLRWQKAGLPAVPVAVNVSPRQFWRGDFHHMVADTIAELGLSGGFLELEITESCLLLDTAEAARLLDRIRELGVRMSLDDFGTGYSSLALIKDLPLDCLKIDRAFVRDLPGDERDALITSIILMLGRGLGLETVAEGVETPEQRDFLLEHGCRPMQGFLFAPALPAEDFGALLARGRVTGAKRHEPGDSSGEG